VSKPHTFLNQWRHIVVTNNYLLNNLSFYIDGEHDSSHNPSLNLQTGEFLIIGNRVDYPFYQAYKGAIDEFRIYNETLSAENVTSLYNFE